MSLTPEQRAKLDFSIDNYNPVMVSSDDWAQVGPFVRWATAECFEYRDETVFSLKDGPHRGPDRVMRAFATAAVTALHSGRDVTPEEVLSDANILLTLEQLKGGTRASVRFFLTAASDIILGVRPDVAGKELEYAIREPYEQKDFDALWGWLVTQPTQLRRERAMLLVAMCMGAGLGNDAALVRARDVEVDDNGVVWLNVEHFRGPYFAPKVPMARTFAKDFMSIVDKKSRESDEPLLGYATRKDYATGYLNKGQSFHVNASRLRATWAVEIIDKAPFLIASSALGKKSFPRLVESLKKRERDKYTPLDGHLDLLLDPFGDWPAFAARNAKEVSIRVGIDDDAEEETPMSKAVADWRGEPKSEDGPDADISPMQRALTALQGGNGAESTTRPSEERPALHAVPDQEERTGERSDGAENQTRRPQNSLADNRTQKYDSRPQKGGKGGCK